MAGANDVFLKQAGTGAAWMGPQSSFDPVLFAREAAFIKIGAKQAEEEGQQKAKDQFLKGLKINPEQVLANDAMEGQQRELDNLNNYLMSIMDTNAGWTPQIQQKAEGEVNRVQNLIKTWKTQEQEFLRHRELIKSDKVVADDMNKNGDIWYAPELHIGKPEFQPYEQEYTDLLENVVATNPRYKDDPVAANNVARTLFRDKHRELLNPIAKPEDIAVLWGKVNDLTVNKIKEVKGSDYNTKTDEYASWDEDVEVTLNNGDKKTIPSIKSNAISFYQGSPDAQYASQYGLNKAPQEVKDKYANSKNPAQDYFLDQIKGYDQGVTTSNVTKNVPKNTVFANGYSADTDWDVKPIQELIKATRVTNDEGNNIITGVTTYGYNVTKNGENQLDINEVVNVPFYYDKNSDTHNKLGEGSTMSIKGAKPFMAATFNQNLDLNKFEAELTKMEYDKPETGTGTLKGKPIRNAYEDFLDKFGKKYEYAQKIGSLQGIIIGDDESSFLTKIGKKDWISGGKFVSGKGLYEVPNGDGTFRTDIVPEMVVPLAFVNDLIYNITKVDFNKALDSYKNKFKSINNFEGLQDNKEPETEGSTGGFDSKKTKVYDPNTTTTTTTTTTNTKQKGSNNGTLDSVWNYNTYDERKKYIKSINPAYEVYNQQDGSIKVFDPDTKEEIILTPTY